MSKPSKAAAIAAAEYHLTTLHRVVSRANDAKRELEKARLDLCSDEKWEKEAAAKRIDSLERVYAIAQTEVKVAKSSYAKAVAEIKEFLAAEEEAKKPVQLKLDMDLAPTTK